MTARPARTISSTKSLKNVQGGFGNDTSRQCAVVLNQIDPLTGLELINPAPTADPVLDPLTGLPVLVGGTNLLRGGEGKRHAQTPRWR